MASVAELLSLVAGQHAVQPKFMAFLEAILQPAVALQEALSALPADFSLDDAIGVQLDAVGKWIGLSRQLETPLTDVYFSFDIEGLGFDEGTWNGKYDPTSELSELPDADYRALLYIKGAANQWDGTAEQLFEIFSDFVSLFPGLTPVYEDRQDMTLLLGVQGYMPSAVARQLILTGYIPLKPAAVRVNYILSSAEGAPLFGFDLDTPTVAGFDTGAWGVTS